MTVLVARAAEILLGVVFAVAAVGKAAIPRAALGMLRGLGLPAALARAGLAVLVAAEALCGAALLLRPGGPAGRLLALALVASFAGASTFVVARGRDVPCACFGRPGPRLGRRTLGRAALLAAALALAATLPSGERLAAADHAYSSAFAAAALLLYRWADAFPTIARLLALRKQTAALL